MSASYQDSIQDLFNFLLLRVSLVDDLMLVVCVRITRHPFNNFNIHNCHIYILCFLVFLYSILQYILEYLYVFFFCAVHDNG